MRSRLPSGPLKPLLILDQHFRQLGELFRPETFDMLAVTCKILGGRNWPMEPDAINARIREASFYVAAYPSLTAEQVARAENLKAVIEVAGGFNEGLAYDACFERGIEVLSCAPGFRQSAAEMTLAMVLAGGRGLVEEHEAFRHGAEHWLDDRQATDFSLLGQTVGFVGYGRIARETHRLMSPFAPEVFAYDPFLAKADVDVTLCDLETLVKRCRVVVMAAVPSRETRGLLDAGLIHGLQQGALVVVISRAWLGAWIFRRCSRRRKTGISGWPRTFFRMSRSVPTIHCGGRAILEGRPGYVKLPPYIGRNGLPFAPFAHPLSILRD